MAKIVIEKEPTEEEKLKPMSIEEIIQLGDLLNRAIHHNQIAIKIPEAEELIDATFFNYMDLKQYKKLDQRPMLLLFWKEGLAKWLNSRILGSTPETNIN